MNEGSVQGVVQRPKNVQSVALDDHTDGVRDGSSTPKTPA